jgi:aryl-alcohol dehydrogenase-like predicted oxidoreductase
LAEVAIHEDVGLLAFSPLAAGVLTGKYEGGKVPAGSRMTLNPDMNGRYTEFSKPAVSAYLDVARRYNLDPAQMAIAFCLDRAFMTSAIIGATSMEQLRLNIAAKDVTLSEEVKAAIANVYRRWPVPI